MLLTAKLMAQTVYDDPHYNYHIKVPENWTIIKTGAQNHISLQDPREIATIDIKIYNVPETITPNGFQLKIMIENYDGWINLFERAGTPTESARAQVNGSYVAVYCLRELANDLKIQDQIAGEYYYLKGPLGYVITIATLKENWPYIQEDIKDTIDSFWIGKGERKQRPERSKPQESWQMQGIKPNNTNALSTLKPLSNMTQLDWKLSLNAEEPPPQEVFQTKDGASNNATEDIKASENAATEPFQVNATIGNNKLFINANGKLMALDEKTGDSLWEFSIGSNNNHLLYDNEILYIIKPKNDKISLYALLAENGAVLYKTYLKSDITDPIAYENKLYLFGPSGARVIEADTADILWQQTSSTNSFQYPPAIDKNIVISSDQNGYLSARNAKTGIIIWSQADENRLKTTPIIYQNTLIIEPQVQTDSLRALDLKTGEIKWQIDQKEMNDIIFAPTVADGILCLIHKTNDPEPAYYLEAHDIETGANIWQLQWHFQKDPIQRPFIAGQELIIPDSEAIMVYDLKTGELKTIFNKKALNLSADESIIAVRCHPDSWFLFTKNTSSGQVTIFRRD